MKRAWCSQSVETIEHVPLRQAQDVAQLAISAVEASEKARRRADEAAEELALAHGARAALAGEVEELQRQMAELPARQQLETGTPVIATVLPSVESSGEVRSEPAPVSSAQINWWACSNPARISCVCGLATSVGALSACELAAV